MTFPENRGDAFYPPVQTIYATIRIKGILGRGRGSQVGETHQSLQAIHEGLDALGFHDVIRREWQSGLVVSVKYPDDPNFRILKVHDYCYERLPLLHPQDFHYQYLPPVCAKSD